MSIIFLGLLFSDTSLEQAYRYSKGGIQIAPHTFQSNLITGIEIIGHCTVINIPPVGSFPMNYKEIIHKTNYWGESNCELGFINLPYIKHQIQQKKVENEIKKRISKDELTYIIIYSLFEPYLNAINKLKSEGYNIKVTLIHTDAVPGRNDMPKYMTPEAVKRGNRLVKLVGCCDNFVLLTKHIAEPLEVGRRPFMVLECICDEDQPISKEKDSSDNICLYTGSLQKAYGICELVDAFKDITDAQLWICGAGETENYIRDVGKEYQNIKFLGFVNKQRLIELRDQCDFLINPRRPEETYTQYSFPSKTAEYMMSGKPVIMYKLAGIPDDYDPYINYLTGETPEQICKELKSIFSCDYSVLKQTAVKAREYMMTEKNKKIQAQRILHFIKAN